MLFSDTKISSLDLTRTIYNTGAVLVLVFVLECVIYPSTPMESYQLTSNNSRPLRSSKPLWHCNIMDLDNIENGDLLLSTEGSGKGALAIS